MDFRTAQAITFAYGKQNYANAGGTYSAFVVEPPFIRTLPSVKFKRQGLVQSYPTSLYPTTSGSMYLDCVIAPDGTTLLLQASHRLNGHSICDAALFIEVDAQAPLLTIHGSLVDSSENTLGEKFLMFQGRGYVMEQKHLALNGFILSNGFISAYLHQEEIDDIYEITTMQPELSPRKELVQVESGRGEEVVAMRLRPARKISLRKPA